MSAIKTVAIAGATGFVGFPLAETLLNDGNFKVHLLVRPASVDSPKMQELKAKGAQIYGLTYGNEAELAAALKDVDAVISALTYSQQSLIDSQLALVNASKAAGVKLFFPSEFGFELLTDTESEVSKAKKHISATARKLGLPTTRLITGFFPEWYPINPSFGFNLEAKEVTIYGSGDEKASWTSMADVARFVAYILANVPLSKLENQDLCLQGDDKTFNQFIKIWEEKHNQKLKVTYKPLEELDERVASNAGDISAAITRELFSGRAHFKKVANGLYPDWNPRGVGAAI
ncbi:NAD(P)-binding protein [Ceratobasidium sp. AG-I]|nr:NAD(P)-binding protein [Ceratobasidium sp. AG-I]